MLHCTDFSLQEIMSTHLNKIGEAEKIHTLVSPAEIP